MRKALIVKCHSEGLAPLALNDGNICHAELGSASLAFEIPKQVRNDKSRAFTLAEVLITLTIIGVIAALTIPNLMQKWQKEATVTKVKKAYNSITRMAGNIKSNTNCSDLDCTGLIDAAYTNRDSKDYHKKFADMAGIKDYQIKATKNWGKLKYMYCENQTCADSQGTAYSDYILTQDNMAYIVQPYTRGSDSKKILIVWAITDPKLTNDGYFYPKTGRSAFEFLIADDLHAEPAVNLYSLLSEKDRYNKNDITTYCDPQNTTVSIVSGANCAARILLDGWKMNY